MRSASMLQIPGRLRLLIPMRGNENAQDCTEAEGLESY